MATVELLRRIPWSLMLCAIGLLAIGLTSIARADELLDGPDLFGQQVTWAFISAPALILALAIPYRTWKSISHLLFIASLPLLIIVFYMEKRGGARCWIQLGLFDVQPSEIVKLTYILVLAQYLMYRDNVRQLTGLITPLMITLAPLVLILLEPDLGSALLFVPILMAMLFAAGLRWKQIGILALVGLVVSPIFWLKMNAEQQSRIVALFKQVDGGPNPGGDRWHQHQSKTVLALGGLLGSQYSGPAVDDPDAYRLFAAHTDFVFCLTGERWGLIGTLVTLALYLLLFGLGLQVAARTREPFGRLIAVGIIALWGAQTIINTGMTTGLLPVVGITLPLMSYGGSSLLMTAIQMGLLLNIGARRGYEVTGEPFQFE